MFGKFELLIVRFSLKEAKDHKRVKKLEISKNTSYKMSAIGGEKRIFQRITRTCV